MTLPGVDEILAAVRELERVSKEAYAKKTLDPACCCAEDETPMFCPAHGPQS